MARALNVWSSIMGFDVTLRTLGDGNSCIGLSSTRQRMGNVGGCCADTDDAFEMAHVRIDDCIAEGAKAITTGRMGIFFETADAPISAVQCGLITHLFECDDVVVVAASY